MLRSSCCVQHEATPLEGQTGGGRDGYHRPHWCLCCGSCDKSPTRRDVAEANIIENFEIIEIIEFIENIENFVTRMEERRSTNRRRERFIRNRRYSPSGRSIPSNSALTGRSLGPSPSTPRGPGTPRLSILRGLAAISDWRSRPSDA